MGQKFFSGGNSGEGFCNYFDGILPAWERLERFFIIKGGPGVGKSTLMKRVAEQAEAQGEEVERFYCSGDPKSLDAVRLVKRGILLADGTAPHCLDPNLPGAAEEILNLGEQIDRNRIVKYRDAVEELTGKNKQSYRRAYAFLKAAAALEEERYREVSSCLDKERVKRCLNDVLGEQSGAAADAKEKKTRRLFLDAITCKGRISFAEELEEKGEGCRITGEYAEAVLDAVSRMLTGGKQELFCHPLLPLRVKHVYLPERRLFLSSGEGTYGLAVAGEDFLQKACHKTAESCHAEAQRMTEAAMLCLMECKELHDELEEIYRECVDFERVTERTEQLLAMLRTGE